MNLSVGEYVYCINESVYSDNISKRNRYKIIDLNEKNIRIRGDKGKLIWIPYLHFTNSPIPFISSTDINDEITDRFNGYVEVTITFSNEEQRWCAFTTADWIINNLIHNEYFNADKLIILKELTKSNIDNVIEELDKSNSLIELTNSYRA